MLKKMILGILLIAAFSAGTALAKEASSAAMLAFEMRMNGQVEQARQFLEEHLTKNPKDAQAYFELSRISFYTHYEREAKDFDDAQKMINKAIKYDKKNARYYYWFGTVAGYNGIAKVHNKQSLLVLPGPMGKSLDGFKKALKLNPDLHDARFKLAGLYDRLPWYMGGSKSNAIKETETLEKISPSHGARSRCQIKPEKSDTEKIDIWQKVLAENPDNADVLAGIAWQYMHGQNDEPIDLGKTFEYIHKAIKLDESHMSLMLVLSGRYFENENYEMAEKTYTYFINSNVRHPVALQVYALRKLANIAMVQGRIKQAGTYMVQAEILDPTNWRSVHLPPKDIFIAP